MRQPSFADKFEYSPKKHPHMAKHPRFEIKRCSKLHFTLAQPKLVFNLFLTLTNFEACVLIKLFLERKSVLQKRMLTMTNHDKQNK